MMVTASKDETGGAGKLRSPTFKRRQSRPSRRSPSQIRGLIERDARIDSVHLRARYISLITLYRGEEGVRRRAGKAAGFLRNMGNVWL